MMTKNQYANFIVDDFCNKNHIDRKSVTNWGDYMRASSSLAVCLEHLGMLNAKDMRYSKTRGGFGTFHPITHLVISTRELLRMLPEDEEQLKYFSIENPTVDKLLELVATYDIDDYMIQINKIGTKLYLEIDHANRSLNIITDMMLND